MTRHEKCRTACTKAMKTLRKPYHRSVKIEIAIRACNSTEFAATNMFGHIWTGVACCKWRARAKAAKVLTDRRM